MFCDSFFKTKTFGLGTSAFSATRDVTMPRDLTATLQSTTAWTERDATDARKAMLRQTMSGFAEKPRRLVGNLHFYFHFFQTLSPENIV